MYSCEYSNDYNRRMNEGFSSLRGSGFVDRKEKMTVVARLREYVNGKYRRIKKSSDEFLISRRKKSHSLHSCNPSKSLPNVDSFLISSTSNGPLKVVDMKIENANFRTLVDTGSSHSLIQQSAFNELKGTWPTQDGTFTLSVAGKTHDKAVTKRVTLVIKFVSVDGETIEIDHEFMIVRADINIGYDAVIGAGLLQDPNLTRAIAAAHWEIYYEGNRKVIPLASNQGLWSSAFTVNPISLEPQESKTIEFYLFGNQPITQNKHTFVGRKIKMI